MIFLTMDFETYFDTKYSLKKQPTSLYVQDERFEAMSVVIKRVGKEPHFFGGPKRVAEAFDRLRPYQDQIIMCCHHSQFDGYIASHHFDFHPKFHICTLSMSRPLHGTEMPLDLGTLAQHYGAPQLKTEMPDVKGKRWRDLSLDERRALALYNRNDVEATEYIARQMIPQLPKTELQIIDLTVRMFTEGMLRINVEEAQKVFDDEREVKQEACKLAGVEPEKLASNPKFAALLEERGYEVPTKWSLKQEKFVPAFAQSDLPFQKMRDSDDEELAALIDARLKVKSTLNETRAQHMLDRANHPVPIYLNYSRAHTMRWSGGDKFNAQNLPRDGRLRRCLEAPDGHMLVVPDAAQIEARVNGAFAGQQDLLDEFKRYDAVGKGNGVPSPYRKMAATIYRCTPEEVTDEQRFVGKVATLGCGYQMGAAKFQLTLEQGMMGPPMIISFEEAQMAINAYRAKNYKIKQTWTELQARLPFLLPTSQRAEEFRGLVFDPKGSVRMPNGLEMHYPRIGYETGQYGTAEFYYWPYDARFKKQIKNKLYGGLLLENLVQWIARCVTAIHALQLSRYYRVILTVHDEVVMCVPNNKAEQCLRDAEEIMAIPPRRLKLPWLEDCPLKAEGEISKFYIKP